MLDIIVGAAIGLISSLVTLIFTNIFQTRRDNKARQWFLEDQKRERQREQFLQRVKEAELYIDQMYNTSHSYTTVITNMLSDNFHPSAMKIVDSLSDEAIVATRKQPYIFYINDPTLSQISEEMLALHQQLINRGSNVVHNFKDLEQDRVELIDNFWKLHGQISSKKVAMLRRLDELLLRY